VLLTTEMFVGGTIAFVLDNTIPGNHSGRGAGGRFVLVLSCRRGWRGEGGWRGAGV